MIKRLWCRLFGHPKLESIGNLRWRCPRCKIEGLLVELLEW